MKTKILIVVLAVALVIVCVKLAMVSVGGGSEQGGEAAVYENIMTRASVRAYTDKAVEDEKVEKLLRAGMAAPSAVNVQPWHFIVVNDKNVLAKIAELTPNASMAKKAPLAIVVCGNLSKTDDENIRAFWVQDASAATQNILLEAHALGLGAVWTGTYPSKERCAKIAELMNLPEYIVPLNTIVIGYPAGETQPKDKWNTENISYNVYGGKEGALVQVDTTPKVKEFKEFDVTKDFRANPFTWFKGDGLLLAAGDKSGFNEMTIGWGALGNIWEKGTSSITVYVSSSRYTYQFMEKSKYFTVMTFDDEHKNVLEYMGSHSGRDGDKVAALGLHTLYTENGTPYFEEASEVYECEMIYHAPFDEKGFGDVPREWYKNRNMGIHSMYMGKIVKAMKKQ